MTIDAQRTDPEDAHRALTKEQRAVHPIALVLMSLVLAYTKATTEAKGRWWSATAQEEDDARAQEWTYSQAAEWISTSYAAFVAFGRDPITRMKEDHRTPDNDRDRAYHERVLAQLVELLGDLSEYPESVIAGIAKVAPIDGLSDYPADFFSPHKPAAEVRIEAAMTGTEDTAPEVADPSASESPPPSSSIPW